MNELILLEDLGHLYPKESSKQKRHYAIYKCYCGNEFKSQISSVKRKNTTSCGCYNKSLITKHGLYDNKLYNAWTNIIQRCLNKNNKAYVNYGNRGISICSEWKNNFMSFYNWALENGYREDLSIDRIDVNGNYEPNNCRWANKTTQMRNTRKIIASNKTGYRGVSFYKSRNKYRAYIGLDYSFKHLGYFDTALEGALAYDKYVIDNNLEHTLNFKG